MRNTRIIYNPVPQRTQEQTADKQKIENRQSTDLKCNKK